MLVSILASGLVFSAVTCENGVCRLVPDDLVSVIDREVVSKETTGIVPDRIVQGSMSEDEFLSFLFGDAPSDATNSDLAFRGKGLVAILLLAVLGGLALNLTPCVLPMIPVNLIVIGASPLRGLLYGLGQMVAFGALGLLAALGGVAFGTIQSSPVFNGVIAVLFLLFALSLFDVFALDFTRFRRRLKGGAFVLGAVSAVLAGACIAPILASVLLLTTRIYAEGRLIGLLLPFAVGLGVALPWPFLGAGLKVLPKPGPWMRWVNRIFGLILVVLAIHYGRLSIPCGSAQELPGARDLTVESFRSKRLAAARTRPLLVYCHASWCKNCSSMERLMASSPRIREALSSMEVVRLDAEDPNALNRLQGFQGIRGLPAFALYLPPSNMIKYGEK